MDHTVNLATEPGINGTSAATLEMTIQSLSEMFGLIKFSSGANIIFFKLKKCFSTLPGNIKNISMQSVQLLVRMTICALQTQTTLDDDLRLIICTGALCLDDKELAKELLQETLHQTLAENSQWIQIVRQQKLQNLQENDDQTFERVILCLESAAKLVELVPEAAAIFQNVALIVPFLFKGEKAFRAMSTAERLLNSAHPLRKFVQAKTIAASLILDAAPPPANEEAPERFLTPFLCDFCQKSFTRMYNIFKHMRIHTGDCPFKCNICARAFRTSDQLVKHTQTHTGEKPFSCNFCNMSFSQKGTLKVHERIHTGERPYKCTVCTKKYTSSGQLLQHTRTHSGGKTYNCDFCNKSFFQKCRLKLHERNHTGKRPYKCTVCPKNFIASGQLLRHTRTHTGGGLSAACAAKALPNPVT